MKQRGVMTVILLSIVTLGIYDLFWLYKVKKELNAKTNVHTPTLWLLFAPALVMVLGIIIGMVMVVANSTPTDAYATSSTPSIAANVIILVSYTFGFLVVVPVTFYWFFKFSKAVSQYTNGGVSTAVTFMLLYLLRFIGMAVIQDHFNDMLAAGTTPGAGAAAPAPMPMSMPSTSDAPSQPADMAAAPSESSQSASTSSDQPQDPSQPTPPAGTPMA